MGNLREGYKMTELGEIPIEWKIKELKSLTDDNDRYSFAGGPFGSDLTSKEYTAEGVQIIQLQNIGDGYFKDSYKIYTSEEKADELKKCNIYPGEIVIAKMAEPVARACIIPNKRKRYLMASDAIRVKVNSYEHDVHFVMYAINSSYFRTSAEAASTGTTRLRIGLTNLAKLKLLVPTLKEQRKIAEILSTVDEQLENTEQLIEKIKELKKGLMQQLLTKGTGHTEFKQTELGEIPVEWEVEKLSNLSEKITDGSHYSPPEVEESSFKICSVKHMLNNEININEGICISSDEYTKLVQNNCKPENGDVLLSKDGTIGKTFVFKQGHENIVLLSSIAIIRLNKEKLNPYFLKFYFENPNTLMRIVGMKSGSAIKRIVLRDINSLLVVVPSLDEQKKIVSILSSIDEQMDSYKQEKAKYQKLKKGLMQQLLRGQLRVRV